jgi:SAM-dependent methyltransferase
MKPKNVSWSIYVRNGLGRRLAQLGERIGSERLIYNPMVMRHFHDDALFNAPRVIPAVLEVFPEAQKFLDVGSGSGAFSAELLRRGKSPVALERSPHGRALAIKQGVDCRPFDLMDVPAAKADGPFDVVYCFEVAEHMPAALGDRLVEFIARYRTTVLFSAAHPGQGGTGHINEQLDTYWIQRFEQRGFRLDRESTDKLRDRFAEREASQWFRDNPFVCRPT